MNHNRDGAGQHRIHKGTLNYFPNRDNIVNPVPPRDGGYDEYVLRLVVTMNFDLTCEWLQIQTEGCRVQTA